MISAIEVLRGDSARKKKRPRGRPRSRSAPAAVSVCEAPKKRKQWTSETMLSAIAAVKNGMSVGRASVIHGVPRSTLHDRISGRVVHGTKSGPLPYLSHQEEDEFSKFIEETAKTGYGRSRKQIKKIAEDVAHDKGLLDKQKSVSDGWYHGFMKRQSHLSLRKGDPIASVRMECLEKETMTEYFQLLKTTLTENNLLNKPNLIYNVDETGMPLDHKPPKVVAAKGQKKVRCRTSGNKSQVTVIACVSASGHAIPPFVIFDAKRLNMDWTNGEVPGTRYGLSSTGWVDTYLFKKWLVEHFLRNAVGDRPLILILDGHGSHYQPDLIKFAKKNEVVLFCLPPHTTHESQPLDTCVFKPLKQNWQDACHRYVQANPGRVVTKYTFSALLNEAWGKTMIPSVISSGFKRSGIYPFNPNAIDYGIDGNSSQQKSNDKQSSKSVPANVSSVAKNSEMQQQRSFSAEQEKLYQRRYEENYNIPDPDYLEWLKINHPSEHVHEPSIVDAAQKDQDSQLQSSSSDEQGDLLQQLQIRYVHVSSNFFKFIFTMHYVFSLVLL